jgi:hypothetical protein
MHFGLAQFVELIEQHVLPPDADLILCSRPDEDILPTSILFR